MSVHVAGVARRAVAEAAMMLAGLPARLCPLDTEATGAQGIVDRAIVRPATC